MGSLIFRNYFVCYVAMFVVLSSVHKCDDGMASEDSSLNKHRFFIYERKAEMQSASYDWFNKFLKFKAKSSSELQRYLSTTKGNFHVRFLNLTSSRCKKLSLTGKCVQARKQRCCANKNPNIISSLLMLPILGIALVLLTSSSNSAMSLSAVCLSDTLGTLGDNEEPVGPPIQFSNEFQLPSPREFPADDVFGWMAQRQINQAGTTLFYLVVLIGIFAKDLRPPFGSSTTFPRIQSYDMTLRIKSKTEGFHDENDNFKDITNLESARRINKRRRAGVILYGKRHRAMNWRNLYEGCHTSQCEKKEKSLWLFVSFISISLLLYFYSTNRNSSLCPPGPTGPTTTMTTTKGSCVGPGCRKRRSPNILGEDDTEAEDGFYLFHAKRPSESKLSTAPAVGHSFDANSKVILDGPTWLSMVHELWEQDDSLENIACARETLCSMNRLAIPSTGQQAEWAISLSSLSLGYLMHVRHAGGFNSFVDAAIMGRSGANCQELYRSCPRLRY